MTNLPTMQAPIRERLLLLYLATNSYAIGALITQEDKSGIERACFAIVYASQRLHHCFLAYEVWLMTQSHAIKALLQ